MQPRKIGPVLATFVVANNMIGSGFFLLPASLATSGSVTVFSWVIGTALALMLGGAFARLARVYPNLQSSDDYVPPSLGRDASFLASSLYWASSWIGNNAIAVAAFGYLVMLLPLDGGNPMVQVGGQVALIWLMFAVNLLGPKPVAKFQSWCVVLGLLPVAVVLLFGWGHFDAATYDGAWNVTDASDASLVFGSLGAVFWAFVGLETGAMIAGLVRDPDRDVPIATLGGIAIAGVVYIVSSVLVMGIVPAADLAASSAPFALVAAEIFGPWAAPIAPRRRRCCTRSCTGASRKSAACCTPIRSCRRSPHASTPRPARCAWKATSCSRRSRATPPTTTRSTCRCCPTARTCRRSPRRWTRCWTTDACGAT